MKLQNATVLVTGANRGLGLAFARHALAQGARKAYAAARNPGAVTLPGVVPIALAIDEWTQQIKRGLSSEPGIYLDYTR